MEERFELVSVDVNDVAAMAKWAHGMFRGLSLKELGSLCKVEPTELAVLAEVGRGFPEKARKVVVEVCGEELRKTEAEARKSSTAPTV